MLATLIMTHKFHSAQERLLVQTEPFLRSPEQEILTSTCHAASQ